MACKHKSLFRVYCPLIKQVINLKSYVYLCKCTCGNIPSRTMEFEDLRYDQLSKEAKEEADKLPFDTCDCEDIPRVFTYTEPIKE